MSDAAITTHGLTKHFGSTVALDDVDLEVRRGEVFGYLGPNGAGKTTTLRLLLGLIRPTRGTAEVLGIDVADVEQAHRQMAYVPGDVSLWPKLTGEECLHLFAQLHGSVDTEYRAQLVERFDLDVSKRARAYSKGNRQKVALIAAFASRAELLVMDEPTSGLDPLMEREFQRCVAEATDRGQTLFLSSHLLDEVEELCGRVGILRSGRLVEVAEVEALRTMHGTVLEIDSDDGLPDLATVPGVSAVERTPAGIRVQMTGSVAPLLTALGRSEVTALRSREASLEEVFLGYYGANGDEAP
ncbi:MAG TPA: ABC transporter ATP-binding protein [Actinomycetes bacterium]|nr:ABC transporter ATP-binding protein [Actinomycetes bacterium]